MKIIAVGQNYIDHIKELNSVFPKEPVVFLMPETALVRKNHAFFYPDFSNNVHYEVELVIKINKLGKNIAEKFAHRYYQEIGVGIDFTARDLQTELKAKGLPWEKAKCFDGAAPLSGFVPLSKFGDINNINFSLEKNGKLVQQGNTKDMIFSVDAIIAYVSKFFTLKIGDLIYTGTPVGVGPVVIGDKLIAKIEGEELLSTWVK